MGIDFGTAYTKVCIAEANAAHAVRFFPNSPGARQYLLPGTLLVDSSGTCHLGELASSAEWYDNLKLPLLEHRAQEEDLARVIAFLALAMRYSRSWVLDELVGVYKNLEIDWWVNVGLPTDSWADQWLGARYLGAAHAAWRLSAEKRMISMSSARTLSRQVAESATGKGQRSEALGPEKIHVVPEFAAQVASYSRSPRRRNDLHLMVDVGAGTLDVTTFNVAESESAGGDLLPVFAAKVERKGTHYLMANRLHEIGSPGAWSDAEAVPSAERLSAHLKCAIEEIKLRDSVFRDAVAGTLHHVLAYTKSNRYPGSRRWATGVPVFLCGGGAEVDVYQEAVERCGFRVSAMEIESPARLKSASIGDYGFSRVSVAYGLSFGPEDLGELRPPSAVPDASESSVRERELEDRFVSKDQV